MKLLNTILTKVFSEKNVEILIDKSMTIKESVDS